MGLGLHGGGLAVLKWLLKQGAILTVTDIKTRQQLKTSLDKIKTTKKIKYTLGKHELSDFKNQDMIVQNPGVPADSKYLKYARRHNIPIVNEAVMFFGLYPGNIIGVTGTRGKSTTASLLHAILKTQIKNNILAGNIATVPMFSILDEIKENAWPVLELSSWHLENLAEYRKSPQIAVVTNVMVDHLNRYKNYTAYKRAKLINVKYQSKDDIAVLNYDNKDTKSFARKTKAKVYYFSLRRKVRGAYQKNNWIYFFDGKQTKRVMSFKNVKLLGDHNRQNILAAIIVAKLLGITNKNIAKAVNKFKGVDYRLEYKGKKNNTEIFNDSTSTTPDATLAAIRALVDRSIVLIAGGEDKQLEYKDLAKEIKKRVNFLILLPGSASEKLIKELRLINFPSYQMLSGIDDLAVAYDLAFKYSTGQKKAILFSPAAASFNMFDNEFDRARQFDKLINGDTKKAKK